MVRLQLILLALFMISCGGEEDLSYLKKEKEPEYQKKKKTGEDIAPIVLEFPRLNDDNAVSFLKEFGKEHNSSRILFETTYGDIEVRLYDDTPIHKANFLYLIHRNYYNPTEILRVVKGFVIQGGNSEEEEPQQLRYIIGEYSLPAEFHDHHIHKKGALAMSRGYEMNPNKRSSAYDFYIVHGRKIGPLELSQNEQEKKRSYSEAQKKIYRETGGAIHLDDEHTVFGEVTKGLDVVDKIAELPVDEGDWPKSRVELRISLLD